MKPIPVLLLAAALTSPGLAQVKTHDASPKPEKQGSHAASLLKIARELRSKGQVDIARQIEAQARRLQKAGKSKPNRERKSEKKNKWFGKDPVRTTGFWVSRAPRTVATKPSRSSSARRVARAPRAVVAPSAPSAPSPVATNRGVASAPTQVWVTRGRGGVADGPVGVVRRTLEQPPQPPRLPGASSPRRPMTAPLGAHTKTFRRGRPSVGDARVDTGRNRFRYQSVPTGKGGQGHVYWLGLPARPGAPEPGRGTARRAPRPDAPSPAPRISRRALEQRVDSLSREVRAMRKALEQLNSQLRHDRRPAKKIQ